MDVIETYRLHLESLGRNPGVIITAIRHIRTLEEACAQEVEPRDIEAYLSDMMDSDYAYAYVMVVFNMFRRYYAWAVDGGYRTGDPAAVAVFGRKHRPLPKDVPCEADVRSILASIPQEHRLDRVLCELAYGVGMRRAEIAGLKTADIDWDNNRILVRGKGGRHRVLPMGAHLRYALTDYLNDERDRLFGKNPCNQYRRKADPDAVFIAPGGYVMSKALVSTRIRRVAQKALGKRVTAHGLRHACAVGMLKHGASIRVIQRMLGHERLNTTMVYTRIGIEELKEAVRRAHPHET
jgi:site-specific recombinase XerD